jgi:hypothetical protein
LEQTLQQAADAERQGVVRFSTIAELAAELSRQGAPKPQRSILRAA